MKRNQKTFIRPKDTPATRKKRLQERLLEITQRSEKELAAIMQSIDKLKSSIGPKK